MSRRSTLFRFALATLAACVLSVPVLAEETNTAPADSSKGEDRDPAFERACLAAEMALRGEQQESPTLLLAAAQILMDLQTSEGSLELIEVENAGNGEATATSLPALTPDALIARAQELSGDESLGADLGGGSRGLIYSQGKDLPKERIGGITYCVLNTDPKNQRLNPDAIYTITNVIFEGKAPATIGVIGDGDGDLDLWVYDGNNGALIGEDVDTTSRCVVSWTTLYEGPFTVKVKNVGNTWERFYVLANW